MKAAASIALHPAVLTGYYIADWVLRSAEAEGSGAAAFVAPERRLQEHAWTSAQVVGQSCVHLVVFLVVSLVIAAVYKSRINDKRGPFPEQVPEALSLAGKDFKYGTFDCFGDLTYCLYGWCCLDARLADNFSAAQVGDYWTVALVWIGIVAFGQLVGIAAQVASLVLGGTAAVAYVGFLVNVAVGVLWAAWLAGKRRTLRTKLGDTGGDKFLMDCICYWCCGCCTVIQDARQVDEASDTRAECCCNLVHTGAQPAVGPPVLIGAEASGSEKMSA
jgi:Cys-rich protein (TIGR01571 family)